MISEPFKILCWSKFSQYSQVCAGPRSHSVCLAHGHFHLLWHQSFPRHLHHRHMPRISPFSRISPSRISNLTVVARLVARHPHKLLHNIQSRVPVSSSISVLVHFACVIGYRLCAAWSTLPASRLVVDIQLSFVDILILYARVTRRRLCPMQPLRHLVQISITKTQTCHQFHAVLSKFSMFNSLWGMLDALILLLA